MKKEKNIQDIILERPSQNGASFNRSLNYIETGEREVTSDQIVDFAKLYNIDVREVLLESYVTESEEQLLCSRYASFLTLFDQLSDKDKEDVIWVIKQRVSGRL